MPYTFRLLLLCTFLSATGIAQKALPVTDTILVTAPGHQPLIITQAMLLQQKSEDIGTVLIRNHTGAIKDTVTGLKGVLLTDVLNIQSLLPDNPKLFSTYYITCIATDGYTIVFSWNELFNSPAGKHTYLLTAKDGVDITAMKGKIAMICTTDTNTGRRFLKALHEIRIRPAL